MLTSKNSTLISPFGEKLVDLMVPAGSIDDLKAYAHRLPSIQISRRSMCDFELLATGALSPLDRFMGQGDYENVLSGMQLEDGCLFPMPITLPVSSDDDLHLDRDIAIRNSEFELIAVMTIEEIYQWDRDQYEREVIGTQDYRHSKLPELQNLRPLNISGRIQVLNLHRHIEFQEFWLTPSQTREKLTQLQPQDVIAFQSGSPTLPSLEDIEVSEFEYINGLILLQLPVGLPKLGDYDYFNRVRTYQELAEENLDAGRFLLSLIPLSLRYEGTREALLQVLIQRNYGATYSYIGGDMHNSSYSGVDYPSSEVYDSIMRYRHELGIKILPTKMLSGEYSRDGSKGKVKAPMDTPLDIINTASRSQITNKNSWNKFQQALRVKIGEAQSKKHEKGVCIWFTGLSGSGKSTTAEILSWLILDLGRKVTVLDGDVVRTHLSKGLGFSKADRDTNVQRIGFVASELVRLGGVVICSVVSPYQAARNEARNMVGKNQFIEVYVNTPLNICEQRDVKGFYAKARRNEIKGFTGIDAPYEPPEHPEIILDTVENTPEESTKYIIERLIELGFIKDTNPHRNVSL